MSLLDVIPRQRVAPTPTLQIKAPGNPATQFPLVCAAAAHIGVHRLTLYRVLKGQYPDRGDYAARYRAFVQQHQAA